MDQIVRRTKPDEGGQPGRFKRGNPKLAGRMKGVGNKQPKLLKECIMRAAELEGSDGKGKDGLTGFLRRVATEDIKAFAMLLAKVLPLQIATKGDVTVEVSYRTADELKDALGKRGIGVQAVAGLLHPPVTVIEAEAVDVDDDEDD